MIPAAGETVNVTIPVLKTLVVKRFTSEETGEFYAPIGTETKRTAVAVQTTDSAARTLRPARRRQAV